VEQRILAINFDEKLYRELEQLQFEGKQDEIWKVVKKHLGNDKLIRYVYSYRQVQVSRPLMNKRTRCVLEQAKCGSTGNWRE
jgi:hypothetical protein